MATTHLNFRSDSSTYFSQPKTTQDLAISQKIRLCKGKTCSYFSRFPVWITIIKGNIAGIAAVLLFTLKIRLKSDPFGFKWEQYLLFSQGLIIFIAPVYVFSYVKNYPEALFTVIWWPFRRLLPFVMFYLIPNKKAKEMRLKRHKILSGPRAIKKIIFFWRWWSSNEFLFFNEIKMRSASRSNHYHENVSFEIPAQSRVL